MNVDDIVAERIEAARRKAAADKQRRERLAAARKAGLARRHAQKLRNLHPLTGNALTSPPERPRPMPTRAATCPACRVHRTVRLVATVAIAGRPHDVVECPEKTCELRWCLRAERPRIAPAA
ncbi:hypothetical protein [Streptomyces noursei]|uniref:hypothetical protein n=1 Tax=Streptomyces noursei TaxID=1971 RepID=UPI0035DD954D